jgi:hypothetical protein
MITFYSFRFETPLPQPGGLGPRIYIPQEQGGLRHWVPFSSPPTTRRATVEVFDAAPTRDTGWGAPVVLPYNPFAWTEYKTQLTLLL